MTTTGMTTTTHDTSRQRDSRPPFPPRSIQTLPVRCGVWPGWESLPTTNASIRKWHGNSCTCTSGHWAVLPQRRIGTKGRPSRPWRLPRVGSRSPPHFHSHSHPHRDGNGDDDTVVHVANIHGAGRVLRHSRSRVDRNTKPRPYSFYMNSSLK